MSVGFIDAKAYSVYDGTDALLNCKELDHAKWSCNVGVYLYGSAVMLAHTGDIAKWLPHINGFITAAAAYFTSNFILAESCESPGTGPTCNTDQLSFKAYLTRWLSATSSLLPKTEDRICPLLEASVNGALASCNGSPGQAVCGMQWTIGGFDGVVGLGQQMAALEVTQAGLVGRGFEKGSANHWRVYHTDGSIRRRADR